MVAAMLTGCGANNKAPDYAKESSWVVKETDNSKMADVFFVLPTVNMKNMEPGNENIQDEKSRSRFEKTLNMEGGIVSCCNVYAPYYRQATMGCYAGDDGMVDAGNIYRDAMKKYLDVAYEDVKNAWIYYRDNLNGGRPVVLFGYSQGAQMLLMLLEEFGGDEVMKNQLVAVYAIGADVSEEYMKANPGLSVAQSADDTGVIVCFDACDERFEGDNTWSYSINPLSWTTLGEKADKSLNTGCVSVGTDGVVTQEIEEFCGAYIDDENGRLVVTDIADADNYYNAQSVFPQGDYHLYDLTFFYRNLQDNVADRVEAFTK